MQRSTKDSWTAPGTGDLITAVVEDVPAKGQSVLVRALPAAYSAAARDRAVEYVNVTDRRGRDQQVARINSAEMEIIQFAYGCVEPSFTEDEARNIATRFGPSFKKVIAKIDEISGVDKEAIETASAQFQSGGDGTAGESGPDTSGGGS